MTARFKIASLTLAVGVFAALGTHATLAQTSPSRTHAESVSRPTANVLPFERLERIAAGQMSHVTELEVRDLLLKAKGYDAQGMKVEVLLDRRDGYVLSRQVKVPKHLQRHAPYPVPDAAAR